MEIYALILFLISYSVFSNWYSQKLKANFSLKVISFKCEKHNFSYEQIIIILLFLLLIIFCAFRSPSVGTDTLSYKEMYNTFVVSDVGRRYKEPIYWLICSITKLLDLPFTVLLLLVAIIQYYSFYKIIKTYSAMPIFSVFLFVALGIYTSGFNGIRQFLALSFFVLAIDKCIKNDFYSYLILCIFACLCHNSAIVLIPMCLVKHIKINWKFVCSTGIVIVLAIIFLPNIIKFISQFTSRDYYYIYYSSGLYWENVSLYNLAYIVGMFVVFLFLWYIRRNIKEEKDLRIYNVFLTLFYIAICVRTVATFSGLFSLVNRFTMFLQWALVILLPYSIKYFNFQKWKILYVLLIYTLGLIYFIISIGVRQSNNVYPYEFVISKYTSLWWILIILITALTIVLFFINHKMKSRLFKRGIDEGKKDKYNCANL